MASCLDVFSRHVSIRRYTGEAIPEEHVNAIVEAARRAPSSWGLQPLTVIVVRDPEVKVKIAELVGRQEHVARAPIFMVFALDYAKIVEAAKLLGFKPSEPGFGHVAIALVDVGIASAWAAAAAEQLGYGITFIAVYMAACEVADILKTPRYVVPVVGLTIGKPAERPPKQPRHPIEAFRADNMYGDYSQKAKAIVLDEQLKTKYSKVMRVTITPDTFYDQMSVKLLECLRNRGFKI